VIWGDLSFGLVSRRVGVMPMNCPAIHTLNLPAAYPAESVTDMTWISLHLNPRASHLLITIHPVSAPFRLFVESRQVANITTSPWIPTKPPSRREYHTGWAYCGADTASRYASKEMSKLFSNGVSKLNWLCVYT